MTKFSKISLTVAVSASLIFGVSACSGNVNESAVQETAAATGTASPAASPTVSPTETGGTSSDLAALPLYTEASGVPAGWQSLSFNGISFALPADWFESLSGSDTMVGYTSASEADAALPPVDVNGIITSSTSNVTVYSVEPTGWDGEWKGAPENVYRLNVPGAIYSAVLVKPDFVPKDASDTRPYQEVTARIVAENGDEFKLTIHVAQGDYGTSLAKQILGSLTLN